MRKISAAILLSVLSAVPISALAETSPARTGKFYLGAKIGSVEHEVKATDYSESEFALGVIGGYEINKYIAVEAEFADLGKIAADKAKISVRGLNAVLFLPIETGFSLFAKLGKAKTEETYLGLTSIRSAISLGLGCQSNISESVAIRFGMDRYSYGGDLNFYKATANFYSFGGIFKF